MRDRRATSARHPGSAAAACSAPVAMLVVWARRAGAHCSACRPSPASGRGTSPAFSAFLVILLVVVLLAPVSRAADRTWPWSSRRPSCWCCSPSTPSATSSPCCSCSSATRPRSSFAGRTRTVWVVALVALIGGSLVLGAGAGARSRARRSCRWPPVSCSSTYVVVNRELEDERGRRAERMVGDLQAAQRAPAGLRRAGRTSWPPSKQRSRVAGELDESVARHARGGALASTRLGAAACSDEPERAGAAARAPAGADPAGARADAPHHHRAASCAAGRSPPTPPRDDPAGEPRPTSVARVVRLRS